MPIRELPIPDGLEGERADSAIARLLGLSRNQIAQIIEQGGAEQNGTVLVKSDRLQANSWLRVEWEEAKPLEIVAEDIKDLKIIFQDEHLVVVDKPVGVAAHPAPSWKGPTVLGGLQALGVRVTTSGAQERQGIVQRLDVGTSGIMVVAKSEQGYSVLKRMFHDREVKKIYHALVQGRPDPLRGTIEAPIGRHTKHDWKFAVRPDGKRSITHYETIEAFPYASLLEIELETGRTHQIRVHMAALNHPCVGDPLYGADPKLGEKLGLTRQWLHACALFFDHPISGEPMEFHSEYPADLAEALDRLREFSL
ncbi:MAG: RluA family pseudouridine synthase [Microbacteriaceae bacterium]